MNSIELNYPTHTLFLHEMMNGFVKATNIVNGQVYDDMVDAILRERIFDDSVRFDKAKAFAIIVNMAFADGTAQQNVCDLVQKIAFSMRIPDVLQRVGNDKFSQYQNDFAL